jgi:hypothetical protein
MNLKSIEQYIDEGWQLALNTDGPNERRFSIFLFGNELFPRELVGEGSTFQEMLEDLDDCEKEFRGTKNTYLKSRRISQLKEEITE